MPLAAASLLPPALGRITGYFTLEENAVTLLALLSAAVLTALVIDALRQRRLHPASAWGGACVMTSSLLTFLAGHFVT